MLVKSIAFDLVASEFNSHQYPASVGWNTSSNSSRFLAIFSGGRVLMYSLWEGIAEKYYSRLAAYAKCPPGCYCKFLQPGGLLLSLLCSDSLQRLAL